MSFMKPVSKSLKAFSKFNISLLYLGSVCSYNITALRAFEKEKSLARNSSADEKFSPDCESR